MTTIEAFQREFEGRPFSLKMAIAKERAAKQAQLAQEHLQEAEEYQEILKKLEKRSLGA